MFFYVLIIDFPLGLQKHENILLKTFKNQKQENTKNVE